jgi:hypothetical protein
MLLTDAATIPFQTSGACMNYGLLGTKSGWAFVRGKVDGKYTDRVVGSYNVEKSTASNSRNIGRAALRGRCNTPIPDIQHRGG